MKNAVITGATGVIGMALIKKCIENDIHVYAIVNPDSKRLYRIPADKRVTLVKCPLEGYAAAALEEVSDGQPYGPSREMFADLYSASADENVFYHLAWAGTFGEDRNNMTLQRRNADYALAAAALAKRLNCGCFTGVGSQAEYGRYEGRLTGDTPTNPENGYGICKLEAGIRTREVCNKLGLRHEWARVLSIYGPYDGERTMVTSTILKLLKGERASFTKGEQLWDYLYADDCAQALLLIGEKGLHNKIYPIGSGRVRPLREYIEQIRDIVAPGAELGFGEVPYSDKQVMYLLADISELTRDTGFMPQTSFEDGIRRTLEYIKDKDNPSPLGGGDSFRV